MTQQDIIKILKNEDVRLVDGRYSDGFVDLDKLNLLISSGKVEVYINGKLSFVRLWGGNNAG